jgi:hypothetical protein
MRKSARFRVEQCPSSYPVHYRQAFAFSALLYPQCQQRSLRFADMPKTKRSLKILDDI